MRSAMRLALVCAALAAPGCALAPKKPYARDPLFRGGRAVWLAREAEPPNPPANLPIEPPPAPLTSRWE